MPLLNSPQQSSSTEDIQVLDTLTEIASKIQLQEDFRIEHSDFQPLISTPKMVEKLHKLPESLQRKFITLQLRGFLYGVYYNGSLRHGLALNRETPQVNQQQNLENNTFLGVDLEFSDQLHHQNLGQGYYDYHWRITRKEEDGYIAVKKGDLTLHIKGKIHLHPHHIHAKIGDEVGILMPKNLMQNGFYMAVGNAGKPHSTTHHGELVRVYFNLQPEGAIALMKAITTTLNQSAIPFCFKALYNPGDYQRYDSAVLYFDKSSYPVVHQALTSIYAEYHGYFHPEVPLFTKYLAPGLGLAEEPNQRISKQESFGLNRCQIVANGYLAAWQRGDRSPNQLLNSILHHFELFNLDWQRPYLNPNADDIYMSLVIDSENS